MATGPERIIKCTRFSAEFPIPLPPELAEKLDDWEKESTSVSILVTGKTGTGKSTLVNKLVGKKVAQEGEQLDPETCEVTEYQIPPEDTGGIAVTIWDSPGLQDGTKNEKQYLKDIAKKCKNVDLFVYCIRMSERRFVPGRDNADVVAMKKLTSKLGKKLWDNAIIVLTFANEIVAGDSKAEKEKNFMEALDDWTETITARLYHDVRLPEDAVQRIKVIPAGFKKKSLPYPDGSRWLTHLWLQAVQAMKSSARPAMIKINQHRFTTRAEEISKQRDLIFEEKAMELGKKCKKKIDPELAKIIGTSKSQGKTAIPMLMEFFYFETEEFDFIHVHIVHRPDHDGSSTSHDHMYTDQDKKRMCI